MSVRLLPPQATKPNIVMAATAPNHPSVCFRKGMWDASQHDAFRGSRPCKVEHFGSVPHLAR
jgi:hypothetical protein